VRYRYEPLFSTVLTACRSHLWSRLMTHLESREQTLLEVCRESTSVDTKGRCFENIVIRRCLAHGVTFDLDGVTINIPISASTTSFPGKSLPKKSFFTRDGVYVPLDPNFPAIDLVWKSGSHFFGVQVHVSKHNDVAEKFIDLCIMAGWFTMLTKVHLIYLSPDCAARKKLVRSRVYPPKQTVTLPSRGSKSAASGAQKKIFLHKRAMVKNSIQCLSDLQWN
jgi:hypothetical protein